jgi:ABC-type transporter Mla MlaB component
MNRSTSASPKVLTQNDLQNPPRPLNLSQFTHIEDSAIPLLSKFSMRELDFSGLVEINEVILQQLTKLKVGLRLSGLSTLTDSEAACLQGFGHQVYLSGLTHISESSARSLSQIQGKLFLDGLTQLTDSVAEFLAKHRVRLLDLSGAKNLSDSVVRVLSHHEGSLRLSSPCELSQEGARVLYSFESRLFFKDSTLRNPTAEHLKLYLRDAKAKTRIDIYDADQLTEELLELIVQYHGKLCLRGIASLTETSARLLSRHRGALYLPDMQTLSMESARQLCKYRGTLQLNGLKTLDEAVASELKNHSYNLVLNGLKSLSDSAAREISQHGGTLVLNGIEVLPDSTACMLSAAGGNLRLGGLKEISVSAAKSLSQRTNLLALGLERLQPLIAKELVNFRGELRLACLQSLQDTEAAIIASSNAHLWIRKKPIGTISAGHKELRKKLKKQRGVYNASSLQFLSRAFAYHISRKSPRDHNKYALKDISGPKQVDISGVKQVDASALKILLKTDDRHLDFGGLETLSSRNAELLASYRGMITISETYNFSDSPGDIALGMIIFQQKNSWKYKEYAERRSCKRLPEWSPKQIKSLGVEGAEYLKEWTRELDLSGLTEVSKYVVRSLCERKDELDLSGITCLSDDIAAELAKYPGRLRLLGLKQISEEGMLSLSTLRNRLVLRLENLSDSMINSLGDNRVTLYTQFVEELTETAARYLSAVPGPIDLRSVKHISPPIAKYLSQNKGDLNLSGLIELSEEEASYLRSHRWCLNLDGLQSVSMETLEILMEHQGFLSLSGLGSDSLVPIRSMASPPSGLMSSDLTSPVSDSIWLNRKLLYHQRLAAYKAHLLREQDAINDGSIHHISSEQESLGKSMYQKWLESEIKAIESGDLTPIQACIRWDSLAQIILDSFRLDNEGNYHLTIPAEVTDRKALDSLNRYFEKKNPQCERPGLDESIIQWLLEQGCPEKSDLSTFRLICLQPSKRFDRFRDPPFENHLKEMAAEGLTLVPEIELALVALAYSCIETSPGGKPDPNAPALQRRTQPNLFKQMGAPHKSRYYTQPDKEHLQHLVRGQSKLIYLNPDVGITISEESVDYFSVACKRKKF